MADELDQNAISPDAQMDAAAAAAGTAAEPAHLSASPVNPALPASDSGAETGSQPGAASSTAAASTAAAAQAQTVRDFLAQQGLGEFSTAADDRQAVERLAQQFRQQQAQLPQLSQLAQYGQHYVQHAAEFQDFLRQREAQAQQQAAAQQAKWQAPEYNPRWLEQLERDANGNVVVKPGGDPTVLAKIRQYTDWKAEQESKFYSDPFGFILPGIQPQIEQMVEQRLQAALAAQQQQQAISAVVQQTQDFLYARDSQGQVVRDSRGQAVFSQPGQMYLQHVALLERSGVRDPQVADQLARQLAGITGGKPAAAAPPTDPKANYVAQATRNAGATRNPSRDNTIAAAADPNAPAQNPQSSFRDMLTAGFREAGLLPTSA